MTIKIIQEFEDFLKSVREKYAPEIKAAENAGHDIVNAAEDYIKTNGLQDLYQIALTVVGAMAPGASWSATLASIVSQATADGVALLKGAEGVVAAKAQADLLAAGKAAGLPATAAQ